MQTRIHLEAIEQTTYKAISRAFETPLKVCLSFTRLMHGLTRNQQLTQSVWGKPIDTEVYLLHYVKVLEAITSFIDPLTIWLCSSRSSTWPPHREYSFGVLLFCCRRASRIFSSTTAVFSNSDDTCLLVHSHGRWWEHITMYGSQGLGSTWPN